MDLRVFDNCKKVVTNVDHVFNLAADMGGMGFIQSNHAVIFYNNTMVSFNVLEAARQTNVKRCARGGQQGGRGPVARGRCRRCPPTCAPCPSLRPSVLRAPTPAVRLWQHACSPRACLMPPSPAWLPGACLGAELLLSASLVPCQAPHPVAAQPPTPAPPHLLIPPPPPARTLCTGSSTPRPRASTRRTSS